MDGTSPVQSCLLMYAVCPPFHLNLMPVPCKDGPSGHWTLGPLPVLLLWVNLCSAFNNCLSPSLIYWDRWQNLACQGLHSSCCCRKGSADILIWPIPWVSSQRHLISMEDSFSHKLLVCRCSSPLYKVKYFHRMPYLFPYAQIIYRLFIIVQ